MENNLEQNAKRQEVPDISTPHPYGSTPDEMALADTSEAAAFQGENLPSSQPFNSESMHITGAQNFTPNSGSGLTIQERHLMQIKQSQIPLTYGSLIQRTPGRLPRNASIGQLSAAQRWVFVRFPLVVDSAADPDDSVLESPIAKRQRMSPSFIAKQKDLKISEESPLRNNLTRSHMVHQQSMHGIGAQSPDNQNSVFGNVTERMHKQLPQSQNIQFVPLTPQPVSVLFNKETSEQYDDVRKR